MKKLLFVSAILLAFCISANAQTDQGTFALGASSQLGFSSTSVDGADDNMNSFNIRFSGGYFFVDNLMFGLSFGYNKMKWGDMIDTDETTFGFFGRYYFENFFGGAGYYSSKEDDNDAMNMFGFEAGYAIFINDFISIEPSLMYLIGTGDADGMNTFGGSIGIAIYI